MARWVLGCPGCKVDFTHSYIDTSTPVPLLDPFAWLDYKPEFPSAGLTLECPNCKKSSVYSRTQLVYRAN